MYLRFILCGIISLAGLANAQTRLTIITTSLPNGMVNVDPSKHLHRAVRETAARFFFGDITGHQLGLAARLPDLFQRRAPRRLIHIVQDLSRSLFREANCDGFPDTSSGAGNNCNSVLQTHRYLVYGK